MTVAARAQLLDRTDAKNYSVWFATLAEPMRVQLLHAVATTPGEISIGVLAEMLGISQATCSHHVRRLRESDFVHTRKEGTTTLVSINEACCTGLPHAADVLMGALAVRPCCAEDLPPDVTVRPMVPGDWLEVRLIYAQGLATANATTETRVPTRAMLDKRWLPDHRWVAEIDGVVAGWASVSPVVLGHAYRAVGEVAVFVREGLRQRGVGKTLLTQVVTAADANGIWTLQALILPENHAALTMHRAQGFRIVGAHERFAWHNGGWRDVLSVERRSPTVAGRPPG
jgi:L-amino acid N-acyltransferase YncA/DNA-binding transcriptional ArsR family regulator